MVEWWKPAPEGVVPDKPWLSPEVIDFLGGLLTPDMRVLEHGSGGSTLWFAERVKKVWAVENDPVWFDAVKAKAPKNVVMRLQAPGSLPKLPGDFDLILIDGVPVEDRALWLKAAPALLKPDGVIVLDNYNRPEYAAERQAVVNSSLFFKAFHAPVGRFLNTEFYFFGASHGG